ncbi:MAG: filamentous hemagglutinin N-terminal domain-containing protein, partial [Synechococcales cyanobacterium RU_4_20]|nr:filamentous hemagglutinin N-terminal domain-containing protein [Synechococcales cyanobacterium RU_4_20]
DGQMGVNFAIDQGKRSGNHLFHSFQSFSVSEGGSVRFENPLEIDSIFVRVTSNLPSNIDGLLMAAGNSSIFLMNPNGIRFGSGASLNIGGSLVATTADEIFFEHGFSFSKNSALPNGFALGQPVSMRLTDRNAGISVSGLGQALGVIDPNTGTPIPPQRLFQVEASDLRLRSGGSLALIGNQITIDNGVISNPSGHIEIAGVKDGSVAISPGSSGQGINFDYSNVSQFGEIRAVKASLIDVSGDPGGSIALTGGFISLLENSKLLSLNEGEKSSGDITINAYELLKLGDELPFQIDPRAFPSPYVTSQVSGNGRAGNIVISTHELIMSNGATVVSAAFSNGIAGDISIDVAESFQILNGISFAGPTILTSQIYDSSQSGKIAINTNRLDVLDGGRITSSSFSTNNAGLVEVFASEEINIAGTIPNEPFSRSVVSSDAFRSGNSGRVVIDTRRLRIADGGEIAASAVAQGDAGEVRINATESIEVTGFSHAFNEDGTLLDPGPSLISSSAPIRSKEFRDFFGLPDVPSGLSGNVQINTPKLVISDRARVTVQNDGPQDAGDIDITADQVILKNAAGITAATANGQGGNILLNVRQGVGLLGNSNISTSAKGPGNGGNITINTDFIAAGLINPGNTIATNPSSPAQPSPTRVRVNQLQAADPIPARSSTTDRAAPTDKTTTSAPTPSTVTAVISTSPYLRCSGLTPAMPNYPVATTSPPPPRTERMALFPSATSNWIP